MSRPPSRVTEIDFELRSLYARYDQLMRERTVLVSAPPVPPVGPPPASAGPLRPGGARPGREASPVSVQTVLLALGGILLGIAAIVFTLVAWSRLGVGGRAAVLFAITAVALGVPVALVRRRLVATAETVAAVGLLLVLLDAYLLRRLDLLDLGGTAPARYAGAVLAVVAGGWTLYGTALPALRGVRPTALVLAQPALPLLVGRGGTLWVAGALLVVAGLDLLVPRPLRVVGAVSGGLAWAWAVLALLPPAYASPVGIVAVVLLVLAGALAVVGAGALGGAREVGVAAGVLVAAAGIVAPLQAALAPVEGGAVLAITTVGLTVAAAGAVSAARLGLRVAAGVLLVPGAVAALAGAVAAFAVPGATAALPWHGVAAPVLPDLPRLLVLVTVLAAAGVALVLRVWRPVLPAATGVLALTAPVVLDLPYPVTLAVLAAATLACWRVPLAAAPLAGLTVAWSLA
ncbi:MAG TPA: hypothetical protein VLM05_06335, partial [Mycobacteriales bacterium]|nr:hypothetical protein [Mycobacteriales bacterium]